MTKRISITKAEIDAIDSALDELKSILESANDEDYEKDSKDRAKKLQNIINKFYKK